MNDLTQDRRAFVRTVIGLALAGVVPYRLTMTTSGGIIWRDPFCQNCTTGEVAAKTWYVIASAICTLTGFVLPRPPQAGEEAARTADLLAKHRSEMPWHAAFILGIENNSPVNAEVRWWLCSEGCDDRIGKLIEILRQPDYLKHDRPD